jgi:hypothetical protein
LQLARHVDPYAVVAPRDAQQAAVVQAVEQVRRRIRRAAPVVANRPVREVRVDVARMRFAALADEFEHGLRAPARRGSPPRSRDARVHQRVVRARQESVVDERVLLDGQRRVQPFEIAGAITGNTVAQCQILRTRGRANRIRLYESQRLHRIGDARRCKQASRNRVAAQMRKGEACIHRR